MPRKNREKSATGICHVMLQGINRQDIFEDDEDYRRFITILRSTVDPHGYIHQNPVKAGLVKEVREYRWSSWPEYEGPGMNRGICSREAVIKRIGWQNLYEFVCMPVDNCHILDINSRDERCQSDTDIKDIIKEICGIEHPTDIQKLAKGQRDDILRQLCLKGVKLRQLSRITGISYGTINRAKSGSREPSP